MRKIFKWLLFTLVTATISLTITPTIFAQTDNGKVEYQVTSLSGPIGNTKHEMTIKISDPDGIRFYEVKEIVSGKVLEGAILVCEAPIYEKIIHIAVPYPNENTPFSVIYWDCTLWEYYQVSEAWIIPDPNPWGEPGNWVEGIKVYPDPRPTEEMETKDTTGGCYLRMITYL